MLYNNGETSIQAVFEKKTQCSVKYIKLVDLNSQHEFNECVSQDLKGKENEMKAESPY